MSPNRLVFQPPKPCHAIGTGIGTLMPTMPICTRRANSRATLPSLVKQATPLPNSCVVDELERRREVGHAHARQHRAEDLFLVDLHRRRDVVEQRAAGEEAVLVARRPSCAAAVDDQRRAFGDAGRDVALDALERLPA